MILVTDDKEFGELIFRLRRRSNGAILMRTATINPHERLKLLLKALSLTDPKGKLSIDEFIPYPPLRFRLDPSRL